LLSGEDYVVKFSNASLDLRRCGEILQGLHDLQLRAKSGNDAARSRLRHLHGLRSQA
jgi:hypothetical protein